MVINHYNYWTPECYAITLSTSQEVCRDHQEVDASLLRSRGIAAGIPSPIFASHFRDLFIVESYAGPFAPPLPRPVTSSLSVGGRSGLDTEVTRRVLRNYLSRRQDGD